MSYPSDADASSRISAMRHRWRLGHPFALLILLLSLGLVLSAWDNARKRELKLAENQFRATAAKLADLVSERMENFELTLRGGVSLFAAVQWPSPQHWRSYVDSLSLQHRFPSVSGLGFAAYVDPAGLANLQLLMRDAGTGLLQVHPRGRRPHYGPIVFLEPRSAENLLAIGYDMYAEPVRHAAMQAAMESGESRLSGMVHLVQDNGEPVRGMLMYSPVYAGTATPATVDERRRAMKGWVYVPFRIRTVVENATAPARGAERMRIVDVSEPVQVVLYEDAGIADGNAFTCSLTVPIQGRHWRFDFFSGPAQAAAPDLVNLNWLLGAGLVVSLLLFGLVWLLASTESRAQRLAMAMTDSYRRSEQRFRSAMQYSAIGKALLDTHGRIVESNPSFARIVGRSSEELVGTPLAGLIDDAGGTPLRTSQMEIQLDDAGEVIRTTRTLHRRGGELRHVQLTFAPVPGDPDRDIARLVQVDDVTERVRAEAAVQALNRTLEARVAARTRELSEANRELESFAYSVSHDLRAPLRAIEGFSRILGERHAGALDATGRDYLQRVRKATERMAELIDALLKLSRIGRSGLNVAPVDLSALAEEVGAGLADAEPERRVELLVQPGMQVQGDRALLLTLLDNLMGNAWKFTHHAAAPRVEVGMEPGQDGMPVYFVRDNGAGFDPDYAGKLFRPFQRLHSQDEFPGHGIGLASVKRIVERHGGQIGAIGVAGQGAKFWFTLGNAVEPATDA
ncbi:MAG TPA: CHASE domain-containing protein, partial [Thermomonas sp.]|nr:CHASE domain-containing protein [Thermomonas sp.]